MVFLVTGKLGWDSNPAHPELSLDFCRGNVLLCNKGKKIERRRMDDSCAKKLIN
jgi:hypothetical protein